MNARTSVKNGREEQVPGSTYRIVSDISGAFGVTSVADLKRAVDVKDGIDTTGTYQKLGRLRTHTNGRAEGVNSTGCGAGDIEGVAVSVVISRNGSGQLAVSGGLLELTLDWTSRLDWRALTINYFTYSSS